MPRAIMLFAAGFGTRMRPLTLSRPKPLVEVSGRAMLDHTLDIVRDAGMDRVVVNTHYRADQIQDHLRGSEVQIIHEAPDILETGGGLKNALPLLGVDPVMTLNTDAIWKGPNPLAALRGAWDPDRMDALLLLIPVGVALPRRSQGDFSLNEAGKLARGGPMIYSGAQIIKTEALSEIAQPAFSLNLLWDRYIQSGRCFGLPYTGKWCDVGAPDNIPLAEALLQGDAHV